MKKLFMGVAAVSALIASPAFAQSADYQVSGTVTATCFVGAGGTITFQPGITIDATTGRLDPNQSASATTPGIWCNGVNSTLTFSGNTLTHTVAGAPSDTDFTKTLTFTPTVSIDGTVFATTDTIGAIYGDIVVSATALDDGGKLPVAGDYAGTITVTLAPLV